MKRLFYHLFVLSRPTACFITNMDLRTLKKSFFILLFFSVIDLSAKDFQLNGSPISLHQFKATNKDISDFNQFVLKPSQITFESNTPDRNRELYEKLQLYLRDFWIK